MNTIVNAARAACLAAAVASVAGPSGASPKSDAKDLRRLQQHNEKVQQQVSAAGIFAAARAEAKKVGLPTCFTDVILVCESGGEPGTIGHDENVAGRKAGKAFLACGKKYSGAAFKGAAKNDDAHDLKSLDLSKPDYGIDWRYSHGFGLSQVTSENGTCGKPNEKQFCTKDGKRGLRVPNIPRGTCMTIPELLTVQGGAKSVVLKLADYYKRQAKGTMNLANADVPTEKVYRVMYAYARGHQPEKDRLKVGETNWACLRTNLFKECARKGTLAGDVSGYDTKCHSWKKDKDAPIACEK